MTLTKYDKAQLPAENIRNDSFLQRLFLTYMYPVVARGRSSLLTDKELRMPANQATEKAVTSFDAAWAEELKLKNSKDPKRKPSLFRALRKSFGSEVVIAGLWKCTWSVFVILGAFYFVRSLVQYVSDPNTTSNVYNKDPIPNKGVGWILSAAFFVDAILVGITLQRMSDVCVRVGVKIRAALMSAVYRKTFNTPGIHQENVVAYVATDCYKLYEGVTHVHNVWTAPGEALALIALLLSVTKGIYGLPALGVVFVILPLQYYFGYLIAKYKIETVEVSDARVQRMHEVLLAIKLVKFYVWEKPFAKQVEKIRDEEIKLMSRTAVIKSLNVSMVFAIPVIIAVVIFATYTYTQGAKAFNSVFAFSVLSLFNTLRIPLVVLPKALRGTAEAIASLYRLEQFLLKEEADDLVRSKDVEVNFENALLVYPSGEEKSAHKQETEFKLSLPKFDVKPGEVVAIVGRVGSGKSSIFQAILNSMQLQQGTMRVGGSVAYVPQTPWVQNLTLRENIVFGLPFDEEKYRKVIHACALELDLQILPHGDQTMAGERGINLSGGQRQRVCLARAAYHDCDLVLLDNPLSAVDQHTALHIFSHCMKNMLKDKAVVWITHQLELLPQCEKICIMDNGNSVYFGPYDADALNTHLPVDHMLFATVEAGESAAKPKADESEEKQKAFTTTGRKSFQRSSNADMKPSDSVHEALAELGATEEEQKSLEKKSEEVTEKHVEQTPEQIAVLFNGVAKRLTAGQAFYVYWAAGGLLLGLFSLGVFMLTQTVRILSDWWVRKWAADDWDWFPVQKDGSSGRYSTEAKALEVYLLSYLAFVILFIILLLCRDFTFSYWHIKGSTKLHNDLFSRILRAPILFFLRTPVGDTLNAFAKDQDTLDETLPDTIHMSTIYLMILLTSLGIVAASIPAYVALVGALLLTFWMMQYLYLPAATVLKRWAGESASAVYVHVDETLQGMEVIKAFDAVNYFIQENIARINQHHLALFNTEQCHLWLAFWCDFFGAILVVATCLFSVGLKEDLGPAAVGLAISNTIQVLVFYTWVVRGVADSVSMWDAVERVTSFIRNVPEELQVASRLSMDRNLASKDGRATPVIANGKQELSTEMVEIKLQDGEGPVDESQLVNWPAKGEIKFHKLCMRYYPGAPLALKFVSFHIKDKEKIGVVGRTGSGKTTLLMALFRMFEPAYGKIIVDGINISTIPLRVSRSRISIIPQEPVMFKGDVRYNLDPFGEKTDAELWNALELVHLKESISAMPGGLSAEVEEGGSNFSLGQKQLVCMARCVLKNSRILVLDEATAAMDLQTDSLIQKTIRKVFKDTTTMTIAHRLDTIIFSDRILAMAAGQLKEFDTPERLLGQPWSMFNKLVEDTGPHASAMLRRMAAEGPKDDDE